MTKLLIRGWERKTIGWRGWVTFASFGSNKRILANKHLITRKNLFTTHKNSTSMSRRLSDAGHATGVCVCQRGEKCKVCVRVCVCVCERERERERELASF